MTTYDPEASKAAYTAYKDALKLLNERADTYGNDDRPDLAGGFDDVRSAMIDGRNYESYGDYLTQVANDYANIKATQPILLEYANDKPDWSEEVDDALRLVWAYPYSRDDISELAMSMSLCPMHFVDWAICFDDEDPTCAQIREIFPHHHDT